MLLVIEQIDESGNMSGESTSNSLLPLSFQSSFEAATARWRMRGCQDVAVMRAGDLEVLATDNEPRGDEGGGYKTKRVSSVESFCERLFPLEVISEKK